MKGRMDPNYISCRTCQQTVQLTNGRYFCACVGHTRVPKKLSESFPASWVVAIDALTESQYQVILMLSQGKTTEEISRLTQRTRKTVKQHLMDARLRLGVKTTYKLVAMVVENEIRKSF